MPLPVRWLLHAVVAELQAEAVRLAERAGWLLGVVQDVLAALGSG